MVIGAAINFVVSKIVGRSAEKTNSIAMKSNALHLLTDVYTSLGVARVCCLQHHWMAFYRSNHRNCISLYIMIEAFKLMKESFPPLMDARLSPDEESKLLQIIQSYQDEYIEFHDFRSRRSGPL